MSKITRTSILLLEVISLAFHLDGNVLAIDKNQLKQHFK